MTRLERKEAELKKLYEYRSAALDRNDIMWFARNQAKMDALVKEIEECKLCAPTKLKYLLDGKDEDLKNQFYVGMLRISLLADAVNEACCCVKDLFKKEFGMADFSLLKEVGEMDKLSQRIASFAIVPNNDFLEDVIVNDEEFVDACMRLATEHIMSKHKNNTKE